jgi:hypothetical protein
MAAFLVVLLVHLGDVVLTLGRPYSVRGEEL